MNRFTRSIARLSFVTGVALAIAACSQAEPEAAATAPAALDDPAQAVTPAPAPLSVASVKFGRYVEPKTYAVGGTGTQFKAGDALFAVVQLEGVADQATVLVRVLDANGQLVAEQSRNVEPKKPMKVNFALSKAALTPIVPGMYKAETLLDGEVVSTTELTFV